MDTHTHLEALKEYIANTKEVLELSSPLLTDISDAEDYRLRLIESFDQIATLANRNNELLNAHFYPIVRKKGRSEKDEQKVLHEFGTLLNDSTAMENIDQPLIQLIAEKLLSDAEASSDQRDLILALDGMVLSTYTMWNLTTRLSPDLKDCFQYRDIGFDAAMRLISYADKERFLSLPDDECRELVLINTRYIRCLFSWEDKEDKRAVNESDLSLMRQALSIAEDPFYREHMPDYLWDIHTLRTLQYLADFTENHNQHEFLPVQLREINGYTKQLFSFLADHDELQESCPAVEQELYRLRNAYLTKDLPREDYQKRLAALIMKRDPDAFSARSLFTYFVLPWEYILSLDKEHLSQEEQQVLRVIYSEMPSYAYRMPKTGVLSFMLTFISDFLKHFIPVPGGISFTDMCMQLIAAMHPPTYIHSLGVADLSRFFAERLIEKEPARLVGVCKTADEDDVCKHKAEILDFIYHAALLHDVGKLLIVETVITYGRRLIDEEFALVREHPVAGAALLAHHSDTAEYAEVAYSHHRWFDNSRGYPETFDETKAKYPAVNAIVEMSDCIDAGTDIVGRNYKDGKDLPALIEELRAGRGTHYAPYLVDLFEDKTVAEGVAYLISDGRDENYRKTYRLLKTL